MSKNKAKSLERDRQEAKNSLVSKSNSGRFLYRPLTDFKAHKGLIDYMKKQSKSFNQVAQIPKFAGLSQRLVAHDFCVDLKPFQYSPKTSPKKISPRKQFPMKPDDSYDIRQQQEDAQKRDRELEVRLLDAVQELMKDTKDHVRREKIRTVMLDPVKAQMMKRFLDQGITKDYRAFVQQKLEVARSELNTKLIQQTVRDGLAKTPNLEVQQEYDRRLAKLTGLRDYFLSSCSAMTLVDLFSRILPDGSLEWLSGDGKYRRNKLGDRIRDKYGIGGQLGVFDMIEGIRDTNPEDLAVPDKILKGLVNTGSYSHSEAGEQNQVNSKPRPSHSLISPEALSKIKNADQPKQKPKIQVSSELAKPNLNHRKSKSVKFPIQRDRKPSMRAIDYEEASFDETVFDPRYIDLTVKAQIEEIYHQMLGDRDSRKGSINRKAHQKRLDRLHKTDQAFMGDSTIKIIENKPELESGKKDDQNPGSIAEQVAIKEITSDLLKSTQQPFYSASPQFNTIDSSLHKEKIQMLFQLNKSSSNVSQILKNEGLSEEQTSGVEMSLEKNPKIIFSKGNSFAVTHNARGQAVADLQGNEEERSASQPKKQQGFVINLAAIPESADLERNFVSGSTAAPHKASELSDAKTKSSWFKRNGEVKPQSFLGVPGIATTQQNQSYSSLPRPPSREHLPYEVHRQQIQAITTQDGLADLQKHELMVKLREKYNYLTDASSSLPKRRILAKSSYLKPFFSSRYKVLRKANQTSADTQDLLDQAEDEPTAGLMEYRIGQDSAAHKASYAGLRSLQHSRTRINDSEHSRREDSAKSSKLNVKALVLDGKLLSQRRKRLTNPTFFLSRSLPKVAADQQSSRREVPGLATFYSAYNSRVPLLNELSQEFRVQDRRLAKITQRVALASQPAGSRSKKAARTFPKADVMLDEFD